MGYGQDYYTLRSIFFDGNPPPSIHMHIRLFEVAKDVPIGDITQANPEATPTETKEGARALEVEIPEREKTEFDLWLRELWRDKDTEIARYLQTGTFDTRGEKPVLIPLKLRKTREVLDAFCFFLPVTLIYGLLRIRG